jgi:hypothetical protein
MLNYLSVHGIVFYILYRKIPLALSDVWRHFTAANIKGKALYICKICAKSYVKNSLAKCIKFPQCSQQATSDKSPSTSIQGENYVPCILSIATAHGPPGIRSCFDSMEERSQRNADEYLARTVYATGSPLMLTGNVYWKRFLNVLRPAFTHPTRHALSTHLLSSSEDQVNRESRLYCNHLGWVVEC